jgi:YYY domain-containing protein
VEAYSGLLILLWLFALWLLGWLALPFSRRVFLHLPDGGLAAGRVLALTLMSLMAFWGAALHLVSLRFTPLLIFGAPLLVGLASFYRLAIHANLRRDLFDWLYHYRRALLISDAVFLLAFLFFVWIRLCRPEINDFEKPMDSAIIGSLSRASFLPAENPWFAGDKFTNYYYFGHLMGALLKRSFNTPLPYAYNLIQPAFCAFFVSTLWSLCVALCGSIWRGTIAAGMVALTGHFEPLRQWLASGTPSLSKSASFPFLDWWSTSRVIPNTINEYPAFTLIIGDAHAHFFALSLAVLFLCACWELVARAPSPSSSGTRTRLGLNFLAITILPGFLLGEILMTNAWDFPLYGLLAVSSAVIHEIHLDRNGTRNSIVKRALAALWPLILALMTAYPFLLRFKSPAGGISGEIWTPLPFTFFLFWGGFLVLWLAVLLLPDHYQSSSQLMPEIAVAQLGIYRVRMSALIVTAIFALTMLWPAFLLPALALLLATTVCELFNLCRGYAPFHVGLFAKRQMFIFLLASVGLVAVVVPLLCYLRGYFGGDLRHQDTVFKFGLQGWMLFGTACSCSFISAFSARSTKKSAPLTNQVFPLIGSICGAVWFVPLFCACSVLNARTRQQRAGAREYSVPLSLNGARQLPLSEQRALTWLEQHALEGEAVIEPVGRLSNRQFVAAYSEYGRVSALTGVPAYIGWPQHAGFWGAPLAEIDQRLFQVEAIYHAPSWREVSRGVAVLPSQGGVRYLFVQISNPGGISISEDALWNDNEASHSQSALLHLVFSSATVKIFAVG